MLDAPCIAVRIAYMPAYTTTLAIDVSLSPIHDNKKHMVL
jgi:hypothetical protein